MKEQFYKDDHMYIYVYALLKIFTMLNLFIYYLFTICHSSLFTITQALMCVIHSYLLFLDFFKDRFSIMLKIFRINLDIKIKNYPKFVADDFLFLF